MQRRRAFALSTIGLACLASFGALSACRAIVGSYEIGDGKDAGGNDAKSDSTAEIAVDSAPPTDGAIDTLVTDDTADAGPLASCLAYKTADPSKADGVYEIAAKEGPTHVFCDMKRGGYTFVALRSSVTNAGAWRGEATVNKTRELTDPGKNEDAVLNIDWTQLGFTEVIYELGPMATATRASFPVLTATEKTGARGALSLLPPPGDKPECIIDGVHYPACSPPPGDGGGPPPGDPGRGLGWLFSPTGVSCWWAWGDTNPGAQDCKTGATGPGHVWVK